MKEGTEVKNMEHACVYQSPFGMMRIRDDEKGITELSFVDEAAETKPETELEKKAVKELKEYFAGKRKKFDLPLSYQGTDFQMKCWKALQEIPYGETRSYKEEAEMTGNVKAVRAVGGANHNNRICIIIPCHRVINADGKLGGYGGGVERKKQLLELEQKYR